MKKIIVFGFALINFFALNQAAQHKESVFTFAQHRAPAAGSPTTSPRVSVVGIGVVISSSPSHAAENTKAAEALAEKRLQAPAMSAKEWTELHVQKNGTTFIININAPQAAVQPAAPAAKTSWSCLSCLSACCLSNAYVQKIQKP
jgi:hypothetical protein